MWCDIMSEYVCVCMWVLFNFQPSHQCMFSDEWMGEFVNSMDCGEIENSIEYITFN